MENNDVSQLHMVIGDLVKQVPSLTARLESGAGERMEVGRNLEPKVKLPESFSGKHSELRNFLVAVETVF